VKKNILGLSLVELKKGFVRLGLKPFVAAQVYNWVFKKNCTDISSMGNISKDNKEKIRDMFSFSWFDSVETLEDEESLATKYVFTLKDKNKVEAVILKERGYDTICISSQVGCALGCKFCMTGTLGLKRNLEVEEIVGQVLYACQEGFNISHLVFMGMGEPMANIDAVLKAMSIMQSEDSFNISFRKMTVSTAGLIKGLQKFFSAKLPVNLALSVGNTDPIKRILLMPVEKTNPLISVVKLIAEARKEYKRMITLEYTVMESRNDDEEAISELINLAKYLDAKVNLINYNIVKDLPYRSVSQNLLLKIRNTIADAEVPVTIRYKKGQSILAGCGQLGEED
jgi:23S rRNA (adenine2503-C2)-methyltransferase